MDALSDGEDTYIGAASWNTSRRPASTPATPPVSFLRTPFPTRSSKRSRQTKALAKELSVVGLMNIQFAIKDDEVYIIEVNPRASAPRPSFPRPRACPWPSWPPRSCSEPSSGISDPWSMRKEGHAPYSVKESVFPFNRFPGVDVLLGPEMRSTGEVMGIDESFGLAFAKAQLAAGQRLPVEGTVFISVNDRDKENVLPSAKILHDQGFAILATKGTAEFLSEHGVPAKRVLKVIEGRPNVVDHIINGDIDLVLNTVTGKRTVHDSKSIRETALLYNVPYTTTVAGARACAEAIREMRHHGLDVRCIQDYHSAS